MIVDPIVLATFVPAALALNLTPGADMIFCLAQGMRGGARPAAAASGGVALGVMVHAGVAGLGLGALVERTPWAFDAIRWAGAAYLLWLAWKTLRSPLASGRATGATAGRAFRDGLLVNLTNPKVILFILAFLPQFTDPARPVLPQFLAMGAVLALGGFVINGAVGAFSGTLGSRLAQGTRAERILRRVSATLFGALALRLVLQGRQA